MLFKYKQSTFLLFSVFVLHWYFFLGNSLKAFFYWTSSIWSINEIYLKYTSCIVSSVRVFSVSQSWLIWKSLLELNSLIQNSVQHDFHLELYPLPLYTPLTKDSKIKWFWLIITGSLTLLKGDGSWGSIYQKNRGVNFSSKKGEVIMRE